MIALRIAVAVLAASQAAITAYVAFPGASADTEVKALLVAASAGLAILVNQLPRIQDDARKQEGDGSWMSSPKPTPGGPPKPS